MAVTIMNMTNRIIMNMKKCLRVKKKKKRENDMGVYIPNMEKPKSCNDCLFQMIDGDFVRNEWLTIESCLIKDDEADGCPLIEIDLVRCGECKWCDDKGKGRALICTNPYIDMDIHPLDFCSYGERRADDNKRRSV